jgi:hypothetical protein
MSITYRCTSGCWGTRASVRSRIRYPPWPCLPPSPQLIAGTGLCWPGQRPGWYSISRGTSPRVTRVCGSSGRFRTPPGWSATSGSWQ